VPRYDRLYAVLAADRDKVSPNWIDVFNDAILFGIIGEETLAFVIRDRSLVDSFRSYFEIMWKISKS